MFIVWDSTFDTGIEVIDEQHKRIVDHINELHDAISAHDHDKINHVFEQMIEYTVSHFSFEESMMENHGYPHTAAHKKVHDAFTDRVSRYQKEWENGKDVSRKLLNDLRIWLTNHIKVEDADYAKAVKIKNMDIDKGWLSKALSRFF